MHRKMGDMIPQRLVLGLGFPSRRLIGDHYVAEATMTIRNDRTGRSISIFRRAMPLYARSARSAHRRKRQHICRLILAAPVTIERPHRLVVAQHDCKVAPISGGRACFRNGVAQHRPDPALAPPERTVDQDVDSGPWLGRLTRSGFHSFDSRARAALRAALS